MKCLSCKCFLWSLCLESSQKGLVIGNESPRALLLGEMAFWSTLLIMEMVVVIGIVMIMRYMPATPRLMYMKCMHITLMPVVRLCTYTTSDCVANGTRTFCRLFLSFGDFQP